MPEGPYKLVTVNNAPERAKRLVGRVVEDVKDQWTIVHAGNVDDATGAYNPHSSDKRRIPLQSQQLTSDADLEDAKKVFTEIHPDVVVSSPDHPVSTLCPDSVVYSSQRRCGRPNNLKQC